MVQVSREAQSRVQRALLSMSDMPSRTLTSRRGPDARGEGEVEAEGHVKDLESEMREPSFEEGGQLLGLEGSVRVAADGREGRGVDGEEGGPLPSPLSSLQQFFGEELPDLVMVGEGGKPAGGGEGSGFGGVEVVEEQEEAETEEERRNRERELELDQQALHVELVLEDVHIDQVGTKPSVFDENESKVHGVGAPGGRGSGGGGKRWCWWPKVP